MSANRTTFRPGDPRAVACAKKARAISPWGRIPYNHNAQRTLRLEAIKRAASRTCAVDASVPCCAPQSKEPTP